MFLLCLCFDPMEISTFTGLNSQGSVAMVVQAVTAIVFPTECFRALLAHLRLKALRKKLGEKGMQIYVSISQYENMKMLLDYQNLNVYINTSVSRGILQTISRLP